MYFCFFQTKTKEKKYYLKFLKITSSKRRKSALYELLLWWHLPDSALLLIHYLSKQ